jgi:O6-methylguanine-DNA--protein-cysteine methyltransferase
MRRIELSSIFETPLGWAGVATSEQGVCGIVLPKKEKKEVQKELNRAEGRVTGTPALSPEGRGNVKTPDLLGKTVTLLQRYFSGECVPFDVPLDLRYYTPFQQAVWRAAADIPYGETRSYAWIAKRLKKPRAARAAGQALGANPVPIIIP